MYDLKAIDNRKRLINKYFAESEKALNLLASKYNIHLDSEGLFKVLIDHFDVSDLTNEVIFKDLDADQIINIVLSFDFEKHRPITVIVFKDSIIPDGVPVYFEKAILKSGGEIWEIHKFDSDPSPSNPHAHNYQNNYKIHLGTGGLFYKKKLIGKISRKNLLTLRKKIVQQICDIQLPVLNV